MTQDGSPGTAEPASLSLAELRAERTSLQSTEDTVSYVRRLAQGRLDLVRAQRRHRSTGTSLDIHEDLSGVLAGQVGGGSVRPPRSTHVPHDHPLLADLESRCDELGFAELVDLSDEALGLLEATLEQFEHECSARRQQLFARIDALTADLVRRYRDGAANVDGLLDD